MRKIITSLATLVVLFTVPDAVQGQGFSGTTPARPRLVVSIVVSGISADRLASFGAGLSGEGFARFAASGVDFRSARYRYMQTLSPAGLATITTGVNPSMHGVVAESWIDYVTGGRVSLIDDPEARGVGGDAGSEDYGPAHVVMPTLGDRLLSTSPGSRVVSIAVDPVSAVVTAGQSGMAWWMDSQRAVWVSSTAYTERLPDWLAVYNTERPAKQYIETGWTPARPVRSYINAANTIFGGQGGGSRVLSFLQGSTPDYGAMLRSPVGNTLVADFACRVVVGERLGADDATDLLNICFDASRHVGERFCSASMEVEDMIYRLDIDIGVMVREIEAQVGGPENVLFVLTSDSGMSDVGSTRDNFNVAQFKTILNSFLGVQFGSGEWVLDYIDRQVYLNRNLIYQLGLNLEDVQNRAAAFVLQFRGVSHILTSTALAGGYFGSGWGEMMQNGFYPRRAGDLILNLMPGWIEQRIGVRNLAGSMYDYDTHVPLVVWGWRVPAGATIDRNVDMTSLATTLARIMDVGRLTASDAELLPIIDNL
ncbi:MAG: alkaline phosphatase family protein [Alistipes sp.]|jgi:predicted AlkP superfamily pyrophosphatase or phosphodiesterase|nr:alkaline phosphatase family protein [Alistipes sp.]